jgi:phosphatidylinositol-3,4,5-trisphosphate 3-phosphatase/dual-specificity protein phosphatase PTEN
MNYIRTLVSGKKKRFVDRKFNLDLSYITPRIIAMAYPAAGIETVYRNDIDSVKKI